MRRIYSEELYRAKISYVYESLHNGDTTNMVIYIGPYETLHQAKRYGRQRGRQINRLATTKSFEMTYERVRDWEEIEIEFEIP
jgi:hypothetical protein